MISVCKNRFVFYLSRPICFAVLYLQLKLICIKRIVQLIRFIYFGKIFNQKYSLFLKNISNIWPKCFSPVKIIWDGNYIMNLCSLYAFYEMNRNISIMVELICWKMYLTFLMNKITRRLFLIRFFRVWICPVPPLGFLITHIEVLLSGHKWLIRCRHFFWTVVDHIPHFRWINLDEMQL